MSQNSDGSQQEKKEPLIQRPFRKYKEKLIKDDAELAHKLQQEEEERSRQFHNDEMLAQQISNDLNNNGCPESRTPAGCLNQEFTRYRGMTEVDALLARQIQEQEKSVARGRSPRQQDAELACIVQQEEADQYQQFHEDKMLAQQISDLDLHERNGIERDAVLAQQIQQGEQSLVPGAGRNEFIPCGPMTEHDAVLAQQIQQGEQSMVPCAGRNEFIPCGAMIEHDAVLAQQIQQEEQSMVPCAGRSEFIPCGPVIEHDAVLAQQIQQEEQSFGAWNQLPGQQDAGGCRRIVGRAPGSRIMIRAGGNGMRRRRPDLPVTAHQAQLPDGEDDPDTLLMTLGGGLESNFINIMRDPNLVIMALRRTPQFTGNQDNVDLNDYEGLLDLAERLGEVQNKGMSSGDIGNLPTHSHQGGATAAGQNSDCQVCLFAFEQGETIRTLPCLHEYHQRCVDEWLQRNSTCPICRQNVKESM